MSQQRVGDGSLQLDLLILCFLAEVDPDGGRRQLGGAGRARHVLDGDRLRVRVKKVVELHHREKVTQLHPAQSKANIGDVNDKVSPRETTVSRQMFDQLIIKVVNHIYGS